MNLPKSVEYPGKQSCSLAKAFGEGLRTEMEKHDDFYFFSPDETTSNRLSEVYEASSRAWMCDIEPWDVHLSEGGRVIEMLSENVLFATMAGHILSGGRGCMASYEAFLPIISSQLDQHLKFLKHVRSLSAFAIALFRECMPVMRAIRLARLLTPTDDGQIEFGDETIRKRHSGQTCQA